MKSPIELALAVVLFSVGLTAPAYAYLDPGSVSMALQVVIGAVASGLIIGKMYFARFMGLFRRGSAAGVKSAQGISEKH